MANFVRNDRRLDVVIFCDMIDHQVPISVIHLPVFCNDENNTPKLPSLMLACYHGNVNCVDVLLEFGAKWTVKDKSGLCPQPRENCITAASRP